MEKYESQQRQIRHSARQIFPLLSRLDMLTQGWQADADSCSFRVKGFDVRLRIEERIEPKHVKIIGDQGGVPIDFAFWIQLHEVDADDTRIRLVLHADLNMMMRMMIGGKIKKGLDQAVDGLAEALNRF